MALAPSDDPKTGLLDIAAILRASEGEPLLRFS